MKKQILSLAVAAALIAPAAMAEISVSGGMDFDIKKKSDQESMTFSQPDMNVHFKATTELNNGWIAGASADIDIKAGAEITDNIVAADNTQFWLTTDFGKFVFTGEGSNGAELLSLDRTDEKIFAGDTYNSLGFGTMAGPVKVVVGVAAFDSTNSDMIDGYSIGAAYDTDAFGVGVSYVKNTVADSSRTGFGANAGVGNVDLAFTFFKTDADDSNVWEMSAGTTVGEIGLYGYYASWDNAAEDDAYGVSAKYDFGGGFTTKVGYDMASTEVSTVGLYIDYSF